MQQTVVGRGLPTRAAYGCGPFCLAEAPAVSRIPSKSATPGTCALSQPVQVLSVNNPRSDAGLIRHPRAFVPRAVTALIGPSTVLGCWGLLGLPEHLVSRGRSSGRSRRPEHGLNRTSCCCLEEHHHRWDFVRTGWQSGTGKVLAREAGGSGCVLLVLGRNGT